MQVEFRKKFLKELVKLPKKDAQQIERFVFEDLPSYMSLEEVGKIEKMVGYKGYYKIRFGDYRVGIKKDVDSIVIETVKHRKEIYKFFP